jgi:disulfide bond formation protein DsbB
LLARLLNVKNTQVLLLIASLIAIICSISAEFVLTKAPCDMCLTTRYLHLAIVCVAAFSLKINKSYMRSILLILIFASMCFAFYHLGVENHWWPGPAKCTLKSTALTMDNIFSEDNGDIVRCDEVNWSIFGLSVTLYNFCLTGLMFWISSIAFSMDSLKRKLES